MIKPGDILMSAPKKRTLSRIILVEATQGFEQLAHAAIYVGDNQIVEASIGKKTYMMPFDKWAKYNNYKIYRVPGGDGRKASMIAKKLVGTDYNFMYGVRAKLMPDKWSKIPSKELMKTPDLFCSTVIAIAYPEIPESLGVHPYHVLPVDIPKSPVVQEVRSMLKSAEMYQGKKVTLNKPFNTPGERKKFAVYTKNESGNVVMVRFGDPNMTIKKDNPDRRRPFRARHHCDTDPGPKWKARYWSCKKW